MNIYIDQKNLLKINNILNKFRDVIKKWKADVKIK